MAVMTLYLCQIHVDMKRSLPKCNTTYVIINLNELPIDVNMTFSKHYYYTHICNAKFDTNPYHVYVHV